jgi:hypothetical protein
VTTAGSLLVTNRIPCLQSLHSIFDQVTFEDLQRVFLNWLERLTWWLSTMVPTFKSKTLITDLYSMNPPDSGEGITFSPDYTS